MRIDIAENGEQRTAFLQPSDFPLEVFLSAGSAGLAHFLCNLILPRETLQNKFFESRITKRHSKPQQLFSASQQS